MRYKVPQDVQREDQIIWFITMRQLIILIIGGGISYLFYVGLKSRYELSTIENALLFIPLAIAAAFAFIQVKGIGLLQLLLYAVEQAFFRPARRRWVGRAGTPFVSRTTQSRAEKAQQKEAEPAAEKTYEKKQFRNLAQLLDQQKK